MTAITTVLMIGATGILLRPTTFDLMVAASGTTGSTSTVVVSSENDQTTATGWDYFDATTNTTRHAAAGLFEDALLFSPVVSPSLQSDSNLSSSAVFELRIGPVTKYARNPLFRGTKPYEHDINNGYSSVLYDPEDNLGKGRYRVFYSASDAGFTPPDCPSNECGAGSAILYATSNNGLTFVKPNLHLQPWYGNSSNNILFMGTTSVAIFDDGVHDKNASRRFKAWGNLVAGDIGAGDHSTRRTRALSTQQQQYPSSTIPITGVGKLEKSSATATGIDSKFSNSTTMPWKRPQAGGLAVSADGLIWTDYKMLQNTSDPDRDTWRFDAQASMFFDTRRRRYAGTMRAFRPCSVCGLCPIWWQPKASGGCLGRISPQCTAAQCNRTVRAIGSSTSISDDFLTTSWGPNEEILANHSDPTYQFYSQVTFPFYDIYLGIVMVFDAADPPDVYGKGKVHCELAWTRDPDMRSGWKRVAPGTDFIPLGSVAERDFDSHICFASSPPLRVKGEGVRMYYMGGDGPHYSPPAGQPGHRNSSFALATLRADGFLGVRALVTKETERAAVAKVLISEASTVPLLVAGPVLIVTVDTNFTSPVATATTTLCENSSLSIRVVSSTLPGGTVQCSTVAGANVTDMALANCTHLDAVVGETVVLEVRLVACATLYTIGFAQRNAESDYWAGGN